MGSVRKDREILHLLRHNVHNCSAYKIYSQVLLNHAGEYQMQSAPVKVLMLLDKSKTQTLSYK